MYVRAGDMNAALKVFDKMTLRTTVTWNSILSGYCKRPGQFEKAQRFFERIPEPDTVSYNTMLACYVLNFDIETTLNFFNKIPIKDVASWNTMISGFAQNGKMHKARELFLAIPERNSVSWSAMISGYVETGDLVSALKLFRVAPLKSVVAWTAMITGYMKYGNVELAEKLFEEMPVKNLVTWNAMVAGYVENCRAEDGLKLFKKLVEIEVMPNQSSFCSVLLACSNLSALALGRQVHSLVCKFPICDDTTVGTSLISMYCKCGELKDAKKLFIEMPRKDVVTWNAMISGLIIELERNIPTIKEWIIQYPVYSHGSPMDVHNKACENHTCFEIGDCCDYLKLPFMIEMRKTEHFKVQPLIHILSKSRGEIFADSGHRWHLGWSHQGELCCEGGCLKLEVKVSNNRNSVVACKVEGSIHMNSLDLAVTGSSCRNLGETV
ncbi:Pentatricopeptide repeat [Dillenia turbinata]|uniref:Pentatricopeptide repeat n=1 Tax=Dillenia turbinata TaxID=194707 RepID=A0AAN8ZRZ4_9MAGN